MNKRIKLTRKFIYISALVFVVLFSVGYSALSTNLYVSGNTKFRAKKDIRITNVTLTGVTGGGVEQFSPTYTSKEVTLGTTFNSSGTVTYFVEITNYSTNEFVINYSINSNYSVSVNENYTNPVGAGTYTAEVVITGTTGTETSIVTFSFSPNTNKLYDILKYEAMDGTYARQYTGEHQDSMNSSLSTENIYYWYASDNDHATEILNKNNVFFANYCWRMIRTTDTGGVKLLFNGNPTIVNNGDTYQYDCGSTRPGRISDILSTTSLAGSYYYSDSYTTSVSGVTTTYTLTDPVSVSVTSSNAALKISDIALNYPYTCKKATAAGTCTQLFKVIDRSSGTTAKVYSSTYRDFLGSSGFNSENSSPAYFGYMYGDVTEEGLLQKKYTSSFGYEKTLIDYLSLSTSYWYSDTIVWDSTQGKYSLVNPIKVSSSSEYNTLAGKYTFRSSNETYTSTRAYYIIGVYSSYMYYISLTSGLDASTYDMDIIIGNSVTNNGNNTYTLNNSNTISLSNWFSNYQDYNGKYICSSINQTTCGTVWSIYSTKREAFSYTEYGASILIAKQRNGLTLSNYVTITYSELGANYSSYKDYKYTCNTTSNICTEESLRYVIAYNQGNYSYMQNRYFGESVTWDGSNYTLVNTIGIDGGVTGNLSSNHYTCISPGAKVCSEVAFIYADKQNEAYNYNYVLLKNGVLNTTELLSNIFSVNDNDSTIKTAIETWYGNKINSTHDQFIEDVIYCNNRNSYSLNSWSPTGWLYSTGLTFNNNSTLSCSSNYDKFSVSNLSAKLNHKVGLLTNYESNLAHNSIVSKGSSCYWTMTPLNYTNELSRYGNIDNYFVSINFIGTCDDITGSSSLGVRPVISLIPGIEFSSGNGSETNPYVIETPETKTLSLFKSNIDSNYTYIFTDTNTGISYNSSSLPVQIPVNHTIQLSVTKANTQIPVTNISYLLGTSLTTNNSSGDSLLMSDNIRVGTILLNDPSKSVIIVSSTANVISNYSSRTCSVSETSMTGTISNYKCFDVPRNQLFKMQNYITIGNNYECHDVANFTAKTYGTTDWGMQILYNSNSFTPTKAYYFVQVGSFADASTTCLYSDS